MIIGAMNHPAVSLLDEINWMAELKLDFIDITLEPPASSASSINIHDVRRALADANMSVVGHTPYYLPFGNPFESIRQAAVEEFKRCIEVFGQLGAKWVNLHPDRHAPFHSRRFIIEQNLRSICEALPAARDAGVGLMIENLPEGFNTASQLGELLEAEPALGLHLDIGHANLLTHQNTTEEVLRAHGSRLKHVHLHDNKGGSADLHLPLGVGTVDIAGSLKFLRQSGYDSTITLEVFSPDRHYFDYSRQVLRRIWDAIEVSHP
jgi:sugar phosphate isomerase/epimerase